MMIPPHSSLLAHFPTERIEAAAAELAEDAGAPLEQARNRVWTETLQAAFRALAYAWREFPTDLRFKN
jgi:hypothetical protein